MEGMAMTKLFHRTLTDIILRIDELKQYQRKGGLDDDERDKFLSDLEHQYEMLYDTVKELIFLDKSEEIDSCMIRALGRHEMPF